MIIQWFPGHMAKTKKLLLENISKVDIILEVLDARIPLSSANPLLGDLLEGKLRLRLLNKTDLADPRATSAFLRDLGQVPKQETLGLCAKDLSGKKKIILKAVEMARFYGHKGRVRAMVAGIPNCGKSTIINLLSGGKKAPVGAKPGFTKSLQRIKVQEDFELLDTPGILWHKFDDKKVGIKLALLGSIKEDVLDRYTLCQYLVQFLKVKGRGNFEKRFSLDLDLPFQELMENMAKKRGMITKGSGVDYERVSSMFLREFQEGKLGSFTLDGEEIDSVWSLDGEPL